MRVAYVSADPGVPVFGRKGCSVHVREVIRALARTGAEVELFAARLGGEPPADFPPVRIIRLPAASGDDLPARERAGLAANDALRSALEEAGPFDLVYERYSLWGHAGMEWARAVGIPSLLEVNAPLVEEQAAHRGLADRPGAEAVAVRAFRAAGAVICVSRDVARYVSAVSGRRAGVHVVPNGVDPDRFPDNLTPSLPGPPGSFTVGFVGTLKPWHGLPVLVEAFDRLHRAHPNTRLLIVGDGPERGPLEADLTARGLTGAAVFTGAVEAAEVPGLLASMDAATAPYPDRPGFYFSPLKVFEYLAAGLPTVASRIGQVSEVIADGVTGLLTPPGDAAALADALGRLRADAGLRSRLGRAGRAAVRAEHTWDAVVRRLLALADRPAVLEV